MFYHVCIASRTSVASAPCMHCVCMSATADVTLPIHLRHRLGVSDDPGVMFVLGSNFVWKAVSK